MIPNLDRKSRDEIFTATRIPVRQTISMFANGDKIEELLEDYPSLKQDDIYACLDYAASLAEE